MANAGLKVTHFPKNRQSKIAPRPTAVRLLVLACKFARRGHDAAISRASLSSASCHRRTFLLNARTPGLASRSAAQACEGRPEPPYSPNRRTICSRAGAWQGKHMSPALLYAAGVPGRFRSDGIASFYGEGARLLHFTTVVLADEFRLEIKAFGQCDRSYTAVHGSHEPCTSTIKTRAASLSPASRTIAARHAPFRGVAQRSCHCRLAFPPLFGDKSCIQVWHTTCSCGCRERNDRKLPC